MKYFTKYLPVPGEIKEGDTFVCATPHGDKYTASSIKNGYVYTSPLSFRFRVRDCIVLKQFLCSKDIQIGDKLKECLEDNVERTVDHFETVLPMGIYVFTDSEFVHIAQAFKVIGEVSPAAIWVKEGMEFEEDDIEQGGGWILYWNKHLTYWSKSKDIDHTFLKLKCPTCNTFH